MRRSGASTLALKVEAGPERPGRLEAAETPRAGAGAGQGCGSRGGSPAAAARPTCSTSIGAQLGPRVVHPRQTAPATGSYERVRPAHSWNSDHPLGRALLFELSRHSDHHANPGRPYAALRSSPDAPQLPTGYPGMIVLALLPPLFWAVMHPRVARWQGT